MMARLGWIETRSGKGGVTYRVRYWVPVQGGESRLESESFSAAFYGGNRKAKHEADAFLAKTLAALQDGRHQQRVRKTLLELTADWAQVRAGEVAEHTLYSEACAIRNHLAAYPGIANTQIQALTREHLDRHYAALREHGVGASTIRTVHRVIRASLNRAKEWKIISDNPASEIKKLDAAPTSLRYWTPEQSAEFLATEGDDARHGLVWTMLLLTGMRIGELIALRWSDVDLQAGTIRIERTLTRDVKGRYVIGLTTKTRNSRRTIRIPASCIEPLRIHRTKQRELQLASARWASPDGDVVFTQKRNPGSPMKYETVRVAFADAVARRGLPELTPHGLRHSFATAMLVAGVHPKVVADILGDNVAVVLRVYSHVTDASRIDAIGTIDRQMTDLLAQRAMQQTMRQH